MKDFNKTFENTAKKILDEELLAYVFPQLNRDILLGIIKEQSSEIQKEAVKDFKKIIKKRKENLKIRLNYVG